MYHSFFLLPLASLLFSSICKVSLVQFSSVAQSCPNLCDSMNSSTLGLLVHHQLPEFIQLMSIELVMPSSHLIFCHPLLLLPQSFPASEFFPVVMYGCEIWTVKKAECQRIGASELWCWRRLLRVLWTARRSNQSILKETSPGCSLEGLMLKLKL